MQYQNNFIYLICLPWSPLRRLEPFWYLHWTSCMVVPCWGMLCKWKDAISTLVTGQYNLEVNQTIVFEYLFRVQYWSTCYLGNQASISGILILKRYLYPAVDYSTGSRLRWTHMRTWTGFHNGCVFPVHDPEAWESLSSSIGSLAEVISSNLIHLWIAWEKWVDHRLMIDSPQ